MNHAGFDRRDLRRIDFGASPGRGGGILGDLACFGKRLGGGKLHFEPLGELVRVAPNVAHFLARVAWNQFPLLSSEKKNPKTFPLSMIPQLESGSLEAAYWLECPNWDVPSRQRAAAERALRLRTAPSILAKNGGGKNSRPLKAFENQGACNTRQ